jgi:hypothetical protein
MYVNVFGGGSALLHLLAGYPKVILALGIAGTVMATIAPQGPGRHLGTGSYLVTLDSAIGQRLPNGDAAERQARQAVIDMLERYEPATIEKMVAETLRACGSGCTDLSTPIVIRDPELLRRILLLHELDRVSTRTQARERSNGRAVATAEQQ